MNRLITDQINELKNDRLHGASWLSRKSINILQMAIQESNMATVSDFIADMKTTATEIAKARPSMISIDNYINQLLNYVIAAAQKTDQLELLRSIALIKGSELIKQSEESPLKAAEFGAKMISNGDVVITCSYSSTVCQTLKIAHSELVQFQVIAAESKYKDNNYGVIMAEQLRQHNVAVTVIEDSELNKQLQNATMVLVGADSILPDGSLINGIPTHKLAKASSKRRIPLYCICETAKFYSQNYKRKHHQPESGFERIPPTLITGIITEKGMLNHDQVINYIGETNLSPF
jgi:translation initiation factor 2B subunit (eIF-2B alpha/beta/delta family)